MLNRNEIQLIVFDFFGTLVKNEASEWQQTLSNIAIKQNLPVDGMDFWVEFSRHEVNFRKTRTNMRNPEQSPVFRTYWEAWRDAFVETFKAMSISGDADAAAAYSIERLTDQEPFQDSDAVLKSLSVKQTAQLTLCGLVTLQRTMLNIKMAGINQYTQSTLPPYKLVDS